MEETRLSIHHIGGRDGTQAFPVLEKFERDIVNVLYDADVECVEAMSQQAHAQYILPYCFGETCKSSSFNITQNPYLSSLRAPNPAYQEFYFFSGGVDYMLSDIHRVTERRHVDLITLDSLFSNPSCPVPPPDFLSIDAQGAEYDILTGAPQTLQSHALGLVVEVEFHPLYQGQKLFGDIAALLSERGFDFVKFLNFHDEISPFRAPIGLRGEGFNGSGDALFLRRPQSLTPIVGVQQLLRLYKLAFIAIVFQQFEFGLKCLQLMKNSEYLSAIPSMLSHVSYYQFLTEIETQLARMSRLFPETTEESRGRFENADVVNPKVKRVARIRKVLHCIPGMLPMLRKCRTLLQKLFLSCIPYEVFLAKMFRRYSPVERVLWRWALTSQMDVLMKKRLAQTRLGKLYLSTYQHKRSDHPSS